MEIQSYIDALSGVLGQEVKTNEHGLHAFILDNIPVMLHFRPVDSSCLLHMEIGYPTGFGGRILSRLLGANFLLSETHGAAISLDERTGLAFLEYTFSLATLDGPGFVAQVEGFVALADVWTKRLQEWNREIESDVDARLGTLFQELERGDEATDSKQGESFPNTMLRV
ncbi:hypothetical protein MASR1M90_08040 [Desulfovibrionales bacterium]